MLKRSTSVALMLVLLGTSGALAKLKVVATMPDIGAVAQAVGGDLVEITTLAAPNQDPHYVDPRPSLMLPLSRADLLIINGMELEKAWLDPLITASRNSELQPGSQGLLDASIFVKRMQVPTVALDRAMGDIHAAGNPHYSYDPRQMRQVALGIGERLSRLDPANAAQYAARGNAYVKELDAIITAERERFSKLPPEKRRVVSYHQSLIYLTDWLGIQEIINVEPRPGIPPTPSHTAKVLQTMKGAKLEVILQEEFYPRKVSDTLARLVKGRVVLLPGGVTKGESYIDRIRRTAEVIYVALSK
ncbi:MAG: metal ABC transporter substrate-binding protein [Bradymonadia bacterium]